MRLNVKLLIQVGGNIYLRDRVTNHNHLTAILIITSKNRHAAGMVGESATHAIYILEITAIVWYSISLLVEPFLFSSKEKRKIIKTSFEQNS